MTAEPDEWARRVLETFRGLKAGDLKIVGDYQLRSLESEGWTSQGIAEGLRRAIGNGWLVTVDSQTVLLTELGVKELAEGGSA